MTLYSYHISKKFNDNWNILWPYCSGHYCLNYRKAREQYKLMVEEDREGKYRLVKYTTLTRGFICKSVVGIIGVPRILESNE